MNQGEANNFLTVLHSKEPEPGDMIWFQRLGYQHCGIYVGNGELIHFTLPDWNECWNRVLAGETQTAMVKRENLRDVAGLIPIYGVNNRFDSSENPPLPQEEIRRRAERLVGLELPYKLLTSNCEHFATMMRYGLPQGGQASWLGFNVDSEFVHQIRESLRETSQTDPHPSEVGEKEDHHGEILISDSLPLVPEA